ncbi:chromosome segregation protein SMC [Aestuariivirga litoralis]|uniref:chromosome segregation protein SMC n=1 Tax=Aestuariivirga litoralis TaxID=2650924 RepID=UPI0018C6A8AD|nr:chromosome segregation protein SMC [Aestuariivirga litoralis]MBG1233338.1 chromosome segregation protein SMC [Aestuariivirga litoralis]
MKFAKLRLTGFKSFVEPTELIIEKGLTGVVGPNGCGKSNLLEALRWVMGENSYKSMRASGMEDVIFSGTTQRPARNMAEVLVTMQNDDRTAPAAFNDAEMLEISREIVRDQGSTYRVNGGEVRARDVQLLFADASTGSRSPALVRQGQIAELINAKPQARRLILEEAAGITGLHTRRHEAELKLKAAEANVARLDDVMAQLETQLASLKRQARQAIKYKQVSAEIRKLEASSLYVAWREAAAALEHDTEALNLATRTLASHTLSASEKLRIRDELGEQLPGLREQEAYKAAMLQRINMERTSLDEEEKRVEARLNELKQRRTQANNDLLREQGLVADTDAVIAKLATEAEALTQALSGDQTLREEAATILQAAAQSLARAQEAADAAGAKLAELSAQRSAFERAVGEHQARVARIEKQSAEIAQRQQDLSARIGSTEDGATLAQAVSHGETVVSEAEHAAGHAEAAIRVARNIETDKRAAHDEARRKADRLQTEVRTLTNLLKASGGDLWPSLLDQITVQPGYEAALGAALGEDIEASADEGAPVFWRGLPPLDHTAALPADAKSLSHFVVAPGALSRVLAHIGVVSKAVGAALQPQLKPGQKLVSVEGDVWRWDGFTSAADAPSAAAKRLAERNRLTEIEENMKQAAADAETAKTEFEQARLNVESGQRAERDKREAWRTATAALDVARKALQAHERRMAENAAQTSALEESARNAAAQLAEAREQHQGAASQFAALPASDGLGAEVQRLRDAMNGERGIYAEARARHDGLEREAKLRGDRLRTIEGEQRDWKTRAAKAQEQAGQLNTRLDETEAAIAEMQAMPQALADKRLKLMNTLAEAEGERRAAADNLATAENAVREADKELRVAQEQAATSREGHARLGAVLESTNARHHTSVARITEVLQCEPQEILAKAELSEENLPATDVIEKRLNELREDRERLGAVNLRADEEAQAVGEQVDKMKSEKDELVQAIAKLRGGIGSLNREGRQRLLDAFETVNTKFSELFTTLFDGGKAELQLIESDDPLEAGLEILANPPGKKATTLSLLSGGEQTLTALSLIFAVFLTNPSPICVMDEVDAPLDDHNIERFCNLLDAMLQRTETRFLIITHHPLTMARMHRLFGVTMMERGVSQLVSVNLEEAEQLIDAA